MPAGPLPQSHPWSYQVTGQTALSQPGPLSPLHSSPAFASVLLYLPGKVPAFGAWVCLGSEPVPVSHVLHWDGAELDTEHDQLHMAHWLLGETLPSHFSLWPWSLGSQGLACTPGDEEQCLRTGWHTCLYAHCLCCGTRVPNGAVPSIVRIPGLASHLPVVASGPMPCEDLTAHLLTSTLWAWMPSLEAWNAWWEGSSTSFCLWPEEGAGRCENLREQRTYWELLPRPFWEFTWGLDLLLLPFPLVNFS